MDRLEDTYWEFIQNLEIQMEKLSQVVKKRPKGNLPSDTKVNPKMKGNEHCKDVALQSGKVLEEKQAIKEPKHKDVEKEKS